MATWFLVWREGMDVPDIYSVGSVARQAAGAMALRNLGATVSVIRARSSDPIGTITYQDNPNVTGALPSSA